MKTVTAIRTTLTKHPTEYTRGRAAHPALAPYARPEDLLSALALSSPLPYEDRDGITLALIAEHQRAAHPLWQSILLVAYEPLLAGAWKRLHDKRDAEPRLVLALLEALAKVSLAHPPSRLALHLRHAVERIVFGSTAEARVEPDLVPMKEARQVVSPEGPETALLRADEERRLTRELETLFGAEAPVMLDVLTHARSGREPLVTLIAERHPELTSKQRARLYDELQRMRRRALAHLEERFAFTA
ncbi:MAG TPA: hypothetical protein VGI39_19000 [Polyangiaceae bacterium]|jgi:hypothetical protein